jgi:flavin reductase (DIM6/NTAB) family NADH-FMN oxidoreductase RutF
MKVSLGAKTILFPAPVWIVGTYDADGKANVMAVAWGGICCSKPPCVTVSLRKATYSYRGIADRKAFTINVPSEEFVAEADYYGIASGREVDKFSATNLTPLRSDLVNAPYIAEFPMIAECRLLHSFEIGLHTMFIGEILDVKVDRDLIGEDGKPSMAKVAPVLYGPGTHRYYRVGEDLGEAYLVGNKFLEPRDRRNSD